MRILYSSIVLLSVLLLSACGGKSKTAPVSAHGDTITLHYADNLSLVRHKEYTVAQLKNPWDTTKILHTYILIDKQLPLPKELPGGTIIRTPLSKAVVYSSVHCSLLEQLGAIKSIAGVCDLKYINLQEIHDACQEGEIADIGDGLNPDIEKIIDLHPDAILLSPFENSGGYGRIEKLNVPIVECADYMETSALGRAEWMRFYGLLFGKTNAADSLFTRVEENYNTLKERVKQEKDRPTVMADLKTSSTWYTPGGRSTVAGLYADAGADYIFKEDVHSGSLPLSFEAILEKGQQADFWLIKYNQAKDKTYKELESDYAPYSGFQAFKARHIYGCNTYTVPFYEESPFHPDWYLEDLIKIFHPSLLKAHQLRYFTKLAD
ncbi:MAG: ABC transporter substrate-binding protein [Bacteroides sp.]|jgi:iron complex transport system substrate-binding protein|nr:ABC transporter substrate-binding protein [Bacteroides sp.]MCI1680928.1 ABC transporter substrate-binding protein [Bacteroides sp.]